MGSGANELGLPSPCNIVGQYFYDPKLSLDENQTATPAATWHFLRLCDDAVGIGRLAEFHAEFEQLANEHSYILSREGR